MKDQDRDLEHRFHEMRSADERSAAPFARVLAGRPARRYRVLWPVLATSVAMLALVVWRLTAAPQTPFVIRAGDLRVPTDYLLDFVSLPRAGEIPSIGVNDWFPLEPSGDNRRQQ